MPRETQIAVSRSQGDNYTKSPSVRSEIYGHAVKDESAGLSALQNGLNSFFGGVSSAFGDIQTAEHAKRMQEIEQENQRQQWEGQKQGLTNGTLTPEQTADLDYLLPYNKAKAGRAASEDSQAFINDVLPKLGVGDDPFKALDQYVGEKTKGIQNVQFGNEYAIAMFGATNEAIQQHSANAFTQKRYELQEDWKADVGMKLASGMITNVQQFLNEAAIGGQLNNPHNPIDGERWAVAKMLEAARAKDTDGTLMNSFVSMLQEPVDPTPSNPDGLSFATRFPDGFNDMVREASKNSDFTFDKKVDDWGHDIDTLIAQDDYNGAMVQLLHGRETYGKDQFRQQELQIINGMQKGAEKAGGIQTLLHPGTTVGEDSATPDPELITKYGDDALDVIREKLGPVGMAKYMQEWNTIPPDFTKELNLNLTKTGAPESVAAYYTQMGKPLMENMPAALLGQIDDDAEFVMRYIHDSEVLGSANPVDAARQALGALDNMRAKGMDPKSVKLWDDTAGAQGKYMVDVKGQLEKAISGNGFFARNLPNIVGGKDNVHVPDYLVSNFYVPAIQRRALAYMAAGRSDAISKATQDVVDMAGAHMSVLPNADGKTYVTENNAPATAQKWQKQELPNGEVYDPVETFRTESNDPKLSFLHGGEAAGPLELRQGRNTAVDGGMEVFGANGMPITFGAGQTIEWEVDTGPKPVLDANGQPIPGVFKQGSDLTRIQKQTLVLPKDEMAAENMLTEMFGDSGFRVSKMADGAWQLEYLLQPRKQPDLAQLGREKDLETEVNMEHAQYVSSQNMTAVRGRALSPAATNTQRALQDSARAMIGQLQDSGMLPSSTGTTRPLPQFTKPEEVMDYIRTEVSTKKQQNAGMPVDNWNAPVSDKYVTVRQGMIKQFEGVRSKVYKDTKGVATVGIGINLNMPYNVQYLESIGVDVKALKAGKVSLTQEQIQLSFENAVKVAEDVVSKKITAPLNSYQRAALVSAAYNGPSLLSDDLVRAVNSGHWAEASKILGSKKINSTRRKEEARNLTRGVDPRRLG